VIAVAAGNGGDSGVSRTTSTGQSQNPPADPEAEEHAHDSNIYVLDLRSHRLKQLTSGQIAQQPSWAPNKRITFTAADCDDSCWSKLFYVDSKGINQVLVQVKANHHLFHPTWSSDGRIAAVALGRGIFSVSPADPKTRTLTSGQSDEAPRWAPKGNWIAFDKRVSGTNYDLFAVNAVTGKVKRFTHDPRQQTNPTWSPDGSRLAFAEQQPNGTWAIFTMRIDGSDRRRITGNGYSAQEPAWSPDGSRIAFVKQSLDRASLAVVGLDGRHAQTLTKKNLFASTPVWSPDGESLAFSALPGEKAQQ
jgi:TolB protein